MSCKWGYHYQSRMGSCNYGQLYSSIRFGSILWRFPWELFKTIRTKKNCKHNRYQNDEAKYEPKKYDISGSRVVCIDTDESTLNFRNIGSPAWCERELSTMLLKLSEYLFAYSYSIIFDIWYPRFIL